MKNIILALAILCGLIRILFVTTQEQLPVMWDARLYSSAALGTIHYLSNPERFAHPETATSVEMIKHKSDFKYSMQKYIDGEQIEWLYYQTPDMLTAQEYLFIAGPVYPVYVAAVFWVSPISDFMIVRLLNGLVESFCLVLLMLIAGMLFNNRVAIISGVLYCLCLPFIVLSGMVSPDSLTILLTLLSVYLLVNWSRKSKTSYLYLAGLSIGLLVLTRSTATLIIVPFILGIIYDNRSDVKYCLISLKRLIIPFLLIVIPWLIIASNYYGQLTLRDPSYAEANLKNSSMIESEGYDLDYFGDDYAGKSAFEIVMNDKTGYVELLAKKFIRLWSQPFNDFGQYFILNKFLADLIHLIIILTGLFGVFIFLIKQEKGCVYLFLIPAYYTGLHIIFHALARYNLNAMPMMIIAGSAVMFYTYTFLKETITKNRQNTILLFVVIIGILIIMFPPTAGLISIFGISIGLVMSMLLRIVIYAGVILLLCFVLRGLIGKTSAMKIISIPSVLLLALLIIIGNSHKSWAEWKTTLNGGDYNSLGVKIFLPDNFRLQENDRVRAAIDMTSTRNCRTPFTLKIDEAEAPFYLNKPPISDSYYKKMTYSVFQKYHDIKNEEMRVWRRIPLPVQLFNDQADKYGYIDISLICEGNIKTANHYYLYGNYAMQGNTTAIIPGFNNNSIERFVELGDPRIWEEYLLSSDSVISYNRINGKLNYNDLSESNGYQFGRYRIFLEVMKADGRKYYL